MDPAGVEGAEAASRDREPIAVSDELGSSFLQNLPANALAVARARAAGLSVIPSGRGLPGPADLR